MKPFGEHLGGVTPRARGRFRGLEETLVGDRLEKAHKIRGQNELHPPEGKDELPRPE